MRQRTPYAFAGLLIIALLAVLGFAAVSTDTGPARDSRIAVDVVVPGTASGRVAAAVFATALTPPAEFEAPPDPIGLPEVVPTDPPRISTTTTTTPEVARAPATTRAPTTTKPPATTTTTTTTTTAAPTTTAPPPPPTTTTTTTTEPPVEGGARDVEEWRPLVEQYFPPERVDEALSVIDCESHGDPQAYNAVSGAAGLFQFIPNTWNWASTNAGWAGASAFDPEANVAAAAWLVQHSIDTGHPEGPWGHWVCQP